MHIISPSIGQFMSNTLSIGVFILIAYVAKDLFKENSKSKLSHTIISIWLTLMGSIAAWLFFHPFIFIL